MTIDKYTYEIKKFAVNGGYKFRVTNPRRASSFLAVFFFFFFFFAKKTYLSNWTEIKIFLYKVKGQRMSPRMRRNQENLTKTKTIQTVNEKTIELDTKNKGKNFCLKFLGMSFDWTMFAIRMSWCSSSESMVYPSIYPVSTVWRYLCIFAEVSWKVLGDIYTERYRKQKRKSSMTQPKTSKCKRKTSKKIFTFAIAIAQCKRTLNHKYHCN